MNARLSNLLDDLRNLSTQDCTDLTVSEANEIYVALRLACVSVDAAMITKGDFDWRDARSCAFDGRSY
jgi:hypothetical protein